MLQSFLRFRSVLDRKLAEPVDSCFGSWGVDEQEANVETSATLVVTGALLIITRSY